MPTSFREYVDLASAIKGILDNYPFGNALLREILQNSDDAGARHQKFVLDTRQHPTISLADSTLSKTQGPALLCFNDTVFSESDWQALLTIHGSNKRSEDHKTGKYGLGFRSCYHITDNPHILSADKLAIFDPHYEFGAQPGGMQIRLSEAPQYSDQFQAFHPYFSASTSYYDGTIIPFSPQSIRVLFENFIRDELKMVLLFLKNVATIELHEINEDGVIHWATASVENIHAIATDRGFSRGNDERLVSFRCIIDYHVRDSPVLRHSWRICHSILSAAETTRIMSDQLGFAVGNRLDEEKLFSHVAVAYPLDKPLDTGEGRLFTLLPLPIPTGFPLHAHGIFALMPDRQSLKNPNERGHTTESRENFLVQWNNSIFDVFLPKIWVHLLSILATEDSVDSLWPVFPTPTNDVYLRKLPDARNFVSSTNALAVLDNEDNKILDAMATASVAIFQPPLSLVSLFQTQCETGRVTKLTPLSLRLALLQQRTKLQTLNKAARIHLLEYLVVTPGGGVEFIRDLPLLPTVTDTFVACSPSVSPSQAHLLVSEAAGSLFRKTEPSMIALWMLPPNVQTILCNPQTCQLVGLAPLRPTDLPRLLNPLFGISLHTGSNISLESSGLPASWFADFWTWAVIENIEIPPSIGSSFLIPIAPGDLLRRPDAGLMSKTSLEESHRHALERAGVPFVDSTQAIDERYLDQIPIDVVRPASDISFVLNQIQVNRVLPEHCESLRQYFCIHAVAAPPLMQDQMDIFKSLSIFPIMKPDHIGVLFDKIDGDMIFLTDKSSLIPRVASTTFVDVSLDQPAKNLACLLQPNAFSVAFDEIELLAWSIPYLSIQPPNILDSLLRRLVSRAGDLGSALESLHQQPVSPSSRWIAQNRSVGY
ncbi:hypothetical protein DL96DRAFT_1746475 [Flagelloscypha sp. PMI_526]|nr:hypothetical protein DL96DRAFT_1746475 [Flagelloscypha sp. PMI_526]